MQIILSPMRRDRRLSLEKAGDVLVINGEAFDFSGIPNGATLPREAIDSDWIADDVARDAQGVLTVPVRVPHGANAPQETLFPAPITITQDGPIALPPYEQELEP